MKFINSHIQFNLIIRIGRVFALFIYLITSVTACSFTASIGKKPDTSALESQLEVGKSTEQDIVHVLGVPYGKGSEMIPLKDKPRVLYTYYYEEGSEKDVQRIFLFVFIENGLYDGYMWFSSLPEFQE